MTGSSRPYVGTRTGTPDGDIGHPPSLVADVRRMRPSDVDEIIEIERLIFDEPWWSRDDFLREMRSAQTIYIVAIVDDRIAGYAGVRLLKTHGHITTVAVRSEHRRQGIASRLVRGLKEGCADVGVRRIRLEVRMSSRPARELYRSVGFDLIGVRRGYYPGEDAFIMESQIGADTD